MDSKDCNLEQYIFLENVNTGILQELREAGLLRSNLESTNQDSRAQSEDSHLMTWAKDIKDNTAKVQYKRKPHHFGRVFPQKRQSLGAVRRAVRWAICGDDYVDIDVENCHPTILVQICRALKIPCEALSNYVGNRAACLSEVQSILRADLSEEEAYKESKTLFLKIMYCGSAKISRDKLITPQTQIPECAMKLSQEITSIASALKGYNAQMAEKCKSAQKNNTQVKKNWDASFLAMYLQEWERRVLECVVAVLISEGIVQPPQLDCVLCFDGIMVRRSKVPYEVDTLTKKCSDEVLRSLGLKLVFTEKHSEVGLLKQLQQCSQMALIVSEEQKNCLDSTFMRSLPTYPLQKQYLELFCAKVISPKTEYIWKEWNTEKDGCGNVVMKHFSITTKTAADLKETLKHIQCPSGKPFSEKWMTDSSMRVYNRMDFLPYPGVYHEDPGHEVFNIFKGYSYAIETPIPQSSFNREEMLRPFMNLSTALFEGREDMRDHFLKYPAFKIQRPGEKGPGHIPIIYGKQGTGKTMWWDTFGRIIGKEHYICSSKPSDFFGEHAEGFVCKLITVFDEAETAGLKNFWGALKEASTNTHMVVNAKYAKPIQMKNLAQVAILSNKVRPVQIDYAREKDRRYIAARPTEEYLRPEYNTAFWESLQKHLNSPLFLRCLYDYCMSIDFSDMDWKTERAKFLTESYWNLTEGSALPPLDYLSLLLDQIRIIASSENAEQARTEVYELHKIRVPMIFSSSDATERRPELTWDSAVRFKCKELYESFTRWWDFKSQESGVYTSILPAVFYKTLKTDLHLPLKETRPSNCKSWSFTPCDLDEIVKRACGNRNCEPALDEAEHRALMQQFDISRS